MAIIAFARSDETKPATSPPAAATGGPVDAASANSPLDFTMKNIDGQDVPLAKYKGNVVLIVNVASQCGLTRQYTKLQALHEKYHERGLRVLGFPANDFMGQEPGSEKEIKKFCADNYNVQFDLFSKVHVKGAEQCELYKFLTSPEKNGEFAGEIDWNFAKFLVDREGKVIARFAAKTKPNDPSVTEAIERALSAAAPLRP